MQDYTPRGARKIRTQYNQEPNYIILPPIYYSLNRYYLISIITIIGGWVNANSAFRNKVFDNSFFTSSSSY